MNNQKNGFQKILTVILTVIIASAAIVGGAYAYKIWIAPAKNQPSSEEQNNDQLIGGQKDEHGCLIAAGYSWCQTKQKCLRTWEEVCDGTQDLQGIKQAFIDKYKKPISDVNVQILQNDGTYAKGNVSFGQGPGESGYFFAYKKDGVWKIAADGNGSVSCRYLAYYGFPTSMTDNFCYDSGAVNDFSETGNLVLRQQDGMDRWFLIYEKPGQPALSASLAFIQESFCDFGSGLVPCLEPQFVEGQRAEVTGQTVAPERITVWDLKIIK